MTKKQWFILLAGLPAALGPLSFTSQAHAIDELQAYGIANFGGTGKCGTSDLTHPVHKETAMAFQATFQTLKQAGVWDEVSVRLNSAARGSYFTDASKQSSCTCTSCSCVAEDMVADAGVDDADVIYVHTHGNHNTWSSGLVMGTSSYDCEVRTNENMLLGNAGGDLDFAIIKACQSGDYDVWKNGGYRQQITTTSSVLSVWNAFHGDSSCGDNVTEYVEDYAESSINNGVGENWIDEAYDYSLFGDDDCPVSIVFGESSSKREAMYEKGGWKDRFTTGQKTGSAIYYISGCNPDNGRELP